ncbi:CASP-like protein 1U4 [Phragmites australis]|uniref:CASP-like protein 1U4 n=1 Tax=Phragmites australis TaxID=29695 RepID=UPI002D77D95A|nr:CASP-like protein 1U4 [Phragmites australis]
MCQEEKSAGPSWPHPASLIGRIAGMALAVAAATVMAAASECTVYAAYGARPRTVTFRDFPAFVYLVVATAIAATLEMIAIFLSAWKKGKDKTARKLLPVLAVAVPALLYSSAGAAIAVGWDISYCAANGRRLSVCGRNDSGGFCARVHASMWLSLGAAVVVSAAEWATLQGNHGGSDSDSDSDSVCCHCKH